MTVLGLGGAYLFAGAVPTLSEKTMFAALDAALEGGVSLLDLAPSYGQGAAEEFVGRWIASRRVRERVLVATKVPAIRESASSTRRRVTESLQRLQVENLDLVLVHSWAR